VTIPSRVRALLIGASWTVVAVVAGAQAWGGIDRHAVDRFPDLQVYLGAVRLWREGGSLYDFAAVNTGAPFTYPPFAGLVFHPLTTIPFGIVAALWCVASIAVVLTIAVMAVQHSPWRDLGAAAVTVVLLVLLVSAPVSSNIRFGQISVFLVALLLMDLLKVVPERFQGIATGVAAAIKLTPLIFVPYLWCAGRRRAAVTAAGTFAACVGAAWLIVPGESTRFWFTEIWNVDRVGNIATGGNQALNGALLRWELPDRVRSIAVLLGGGTVVVLALLRAVRAHRNGDSLTAAVIVGVAGLVVSPVSWTHHQVWLVLAALPTVGAACIRNGSGRWWWPATVLVIMLLPVTSVGADLPGRGITGNARLWLAVAVAAVVPFAATRRPEPARAPETETVPG
jgi:alpha-1,2-mannosyltransferase